MKTAVLIALAVLAVSSASTTSHSNWDSFLDFADINKSYDGDDLMHRYRVFSDNVHRINSHNEKGGWQMEVNQFADMTPHEFRCATQHGCFRDASGRHVGGSFRGVTGSCGSFVDSNTVSPDSLDWREKGAVTAAKNQHTWKLEFLSNRAMEGAWAIATGDLVSLSEQQLVDCSLVMVTWLVMADLWTMHSSMLLIMEQNEESEPYEGQKESCDKCTPEVFIKSCVDVTPKQPESTTLCSESRTSIYCD